MRCSVRSSLLLLLLLTLIVAEIRAQTPVPAAPQPSNWNFMNAEEQAAWTAAQAKQGAVSLPLISSVQGPLPPPAVSSNWVEQPAPAATSEPPPAAAPAPTGQLDPVIGYGLAFVLGLLAASGAMFARRRFNNSMTAVELRTRGMVAGAVALVVVAVSAVRFFNPADTDLPAPRQTPAAELTQNGRSEAARVLEKIDGPAAEPRDDVQPPMSESEPCQEIADLTTKAVALGVMQAELETARRRVEAADGEWRAAKELSDHAPASVEKVTAWDAETKQFLKELGDFHERWGLPRVVDGERKVPKAEYDQYQREYAPYRRRSAALDARMNALKAKGPQVKALHDTTAAKAAALARADEEVSQLQTALSAKNTEFETAKAKCEG